MRLRCVLSLVMAAALLGGCGGGSDANENALRDGVYRYELTERYLLDHGIAVEQARGESGVHEVTLDRGRFVDRWRSKDGRVGSCAGTYVADGNRVTFRWTDGCTGDWAMSYAVDGDVVRWSDFEPLDPNAGPEEHKVTEVFNGVPWKRVGDGPEED